MRRIPLTISIFAAALTVLLGLGRIPTTAAQEDPIATPGALDLATPGAGTPAAAEAVAVKLIDQSGREVGSALLSEVVEDGVQVAVDVDPGVLAPGEHGIHVHDTGVCDPGGDQPFASAGGHYNPTGAAHGGPPAMGATGTPGAADAMASPVAATGHAGDLGNIAVGGDGTGRLRIATDRFRLAELGDADGSALVIHANPDDLVTDPSGNSGGRIVCGVVFPPQDGGTTMATPAS